MLRGLELGMYAILALCCVWVDYLLRVRDLSTVCCILPPFFGPSPLVQWRDPSPSSSARHGLVSGFLIKPSV